MRSKITITLTTGIAVVEGVIFDMDGVLSDTQTIHAQVESDLLREHGIELSPEEITREFAGVSDDEMFPRIFGRYGKCVDHLGELIEHKWRMMMEASLGRVRAIPGAVELVAALRQRSASLAVASSSRRAFIEFVLQELNLRDVFGAIASADDVAHGKPAPDIFLLAAKRLGVRAQCCLVIEDGISGMRAAKSAAMYCIGLVPQDGHAGEFPANLLVKTLQEVRLHFQF